MNHCIFHFPRRVIDERHRDFNDVLRVLRIFPGLLNVYQYRDGIIDLSALLNDLRRKDYGVAWLNE